MYFCWYVQTGTARKKAKRGRDGIAEDEEAPKVKDLRIMLEVCANIIIWVDIKRSNPFHGCGIDVDERERRSR
jgi:hypothetical protein